MNEFLQTHTWMAHLDFWWCLKMTMVAIITAISTAVIVWCICVLVSARWQAYQERSARRRRRQEYRVGGVCTPEVTRAWLAAMKEHR